MQKVSAEIDCCGLAGQSLALLLHIDGVKQNIIRNSLSVCLAVPLPAVTMCLNKLGTNL